MSGSIANQEILVTNEVAKRVLGCTAEAERRLLDGGLGLSDFQLVIDNSEVRVRLIAYWKAGAPEVEINVVHITVDPDVPLEYDKTGDGWKYLSDAKEPAGELTLELVEFLKEGETFIKGEELVKRAMKKNVLLGQRHAEALLKNQGAIPEEWRKCCLVFPGSVLLGPDGAHGVPCLSWLANRWCLYFRWLEDDWRSGARLVGSRK